jgi:hypothetical protein
MIKFIAGLFWHYVQTSIHKAWVLINIVAIINQINPKDKWKLYFRGWSHDLSKYRWSESKNFAKVIFKLKSLTYGSDEYRQTLEIIRPSINLHYKRNSHHPECYNSEDGSEKSFDKMSEIDKLEMIADWTAATRRHADGDIFKSIEINQKRFSYSDEDKEYLLTIAKLIN